MNAAATTVIAIIECRHRRRLRCVLCRVRCYAPCMTCRYVVLYNSSATPPSHSDGAVTQAESLPPIRPEEDIPTPTCGHQRNLHIAPAACPPQHTRHFTDDDIEENVAVHVSETDIEQMSFSRVGVRNASPTVTLLACRHARLPSPPISRHSERETDRFVRCINNVALLLRRS